MTLGGIRICHLDIRGILRKRLLLHQEDYLVMGVQGFKQGIHDRLLCLQDT